MKRAIALLLALTAAVCTALIFAVPAYADALDEILLYKITVDVNGDGTLNMVYHIDWLVLDSTSEGPLEWVNIGIPNGNYVSMRGLSSTVQSISPNMSGGSFARIDLDRAYYEGDTVTFEFEVVQDYMYEMNRFTEGETYYEFTPGWFPETDVDKLIIEWNTEGAKSASPANLVENGYYTWETPLDAGDKYTVSVTYPNEAFGFDATKTIINETADYDDGYYDDGYYNNGNYYNGGSSCSGSPIGGLIFLGVIGLIVYSVIKAIKNAAFGSTANFSGGESKKKITREKIVYYPTCPGCGASRTEGKDNCEYCGKSLIKSKETVTEEEIPEEMKQKTSDGTYRYGSDPNTFMRVHVVPVVVPTRSYTSAARTASRSSCVHSSCACASHCACACACACAGGGRAGCTAKDFYNTGLKLEMLKQKKKRK